MCLCLYMFYVSSLIVVIAEGEMRVLLSPEVRWLAQLTEQKTVMERKAAGQEGEVGEREGEEQEVLD